MSREERRRKHFENCDKIYDDCDNYEKCASCVGYIREIEDRAKDLEYQIKRFRKQNKRMFKRK